LEVTSRSIEFGPFEIFGISVNPTIHWYGVIIVAAILAATFVVSWLAKKDEEDTEIVWNGVVWVVLAGVIGARLWSVFFPAGDAGQDRSLSLDYLTDLENGPLAIWSGGLSIFGAVLGGGIVVVLFAYRHKLNMVEWADRVVISVPLGQAIGRWGNFVNQELYGEPTDLPWGIKIDNPLPPYSPDERFHPLFLYESIWNLLLFIVLMYLWTNRRKLFQRGDFLLMYLFGYSVARFFLEYIRVEIPTVGEVNISQVTTGILALIAVTLLILRRQTDILVAEKYPAFPGGLHKKADKKKKKRSRSKASGKSGKKRNPGVRPKKKPGKSR
jgi:phosphatidylglycerol:prolipoprotein diacylglycerol transferase